VLTYPRKPSLGIDIEIVDNYYSGEELAFKVLRRYVKYGADLLFDSELRRKVLGVEIPDIISNHNGVKSLQDEVIFEVENDINAFEEYLRSAIFDAAGFESYCIQELKGLVDKFREEKGTWAGVVLNEWLQGNSLLLAEIPHNLNSPESNLEVSERLRQLSIALRRNRLQDGVE